MGEGPGEPESGAEPGRSVSDPVRLRRGLFGYRRQDVDDALDARDAELGELRQDVAALWLAFAQHDRMIRSLTPPGGEDAPRPAPRPEAGSAEAGAPHGQAAPSPAPGNELSDLDDVLAAIETATRTLEQTFAEEIGEGDAADPKGPPQGGAPPAPGSADPGEERQG